MAQMKNVLNHFNKILLGMLIIVSAACDVKTGDNAGETNRENPTLDNSTQEGEHTREDNNDENPNGTITSDSLNLNTNRIEVDNNQ